LICGVLRLREEPNNWSDPNVSDELRRHLETCEWFEVYDVIEQSAQMQRPTGCHWRMNDRCVPKAEVRDRRRAATTQRVPSAAAGCRVQGPVHEAVIGSPVDAPAVMTGGEAAVQAKGPAIIALATRTSLLSI
jgi:hypothetical protein